MPRTAALVAFAATISNAGCNAWPALPPHTKEAALEHWSSFYAASSEDLYGLLGVPRKAGKRSLRWAFRSRCVQKLRRSADSELSDFLPTLEVRATPVKPLSSPFCHVLRNHAFAKNNLLNLHKGRYLANNLLVQPVGNTCHLSSSH